MAQTDPLLKNVRAVIDLDAKGVDDAFLEIAGPPDQRLGRPGSLLRLQILRR